MKEREMRSLSIREVRAALARLEEIVEAEGELMITRHGRPVARIVPVERPREMRSHKDLRDSMPFQEVPSQILIRQDRDAR